jgi:hypothetical protein
MEMKGSKKAVVKLVKSSNFLMTINDLLKPTKAEIAVYDNWMPKSKHYDKEAELNDFLKYNFSPELGKEITDWWLFKDATTPNWDLISTCTINGKRGLVLVEAKAHVDELKDDSKRTPSGSDNSQKNHESIAEAIAEANAGINKVFTNVTLSRDTCYQLSNRIAHAWWLANRGIPVVLVYLGFLDCTDMKNGTNKLFQIDEDWQNCFQENAKIIGADVLIDQEVNCGASSFKMICRSLNS